MGARVQVTAAANRQEDREVEDMDRQETTGLELNIGNITKLIKHIQVTESSIPMAYIMRLV